MASVRATFDDGLTLEWVDGRLSGDPTLVAVAGAMEGWAPVTPEGPTLDVASWPRDPWAFVALVGMLPDLGPPTFAMDGVPALA